MVQELAGHPIAIRVGGRRQSHSNPIRSPNKNGGSASTSPESPSTLSGSGSGQAPVPTGTGLATDDYPRPAGPRHSNTEDEEVSPSAHLDTEHGDGYQDEEDEQGRKEQQRKKRSLKGEQARQLQKEHDHSSTAQRKVSNTATRNAKIITQPAQKMAM